MLRAEKIFARLRSAEPGPKYDPFVISPFPDIDKFKNSGSAAIDLRLGCWFTALRKTSVPLLSVDPTNKSHESFCEEQYVRFGGSYILHPRSFVLAVTLEWIRLPVNLAGYIHGKSSWGRRGLVIATASVIHPGFTGCITLELTNLGEVPIAIKPGIRISQLCLHDAPSENLEDVDQSSYIGSRKPKIGSVKGDDIADNLMKDQRIFDQSFP